MLPMINYLTDPCVHWPPWLCAEALQDIVTQTPVIFYDETDNAISIFPMSDSNN